MKEVKKQFRKEEYEAVPLFDDILCYPVEEVVQLARISSKIYKTDSTEERSCLIQEFKAKRESIRLIENAPSRLYLWPEGKMPQLTEYTSNRDLRYNHDPDFKPYMFEMLIPENMTPKGAIVCIPGGDQGFSSVHEGYQVCLDFNSLGYQCFFLHNRANFNPWTAKESGVDVARAIRIIRMNADKYRINADNVAVAGFSNGGLTGENCIRYFSGKQTVADHFPGYEPDALDALPGSPDAYLCVYGPRYKDSEFDFTDVVYPPTFFAVGRDDSAMDNLHPTYNSLVEHGVQVEIHTFAGVPHGVAGRKLIDGYVAYPNFEMWLALADSFLQDVYSNKKQPMTQEINRLS
ncbi:MAG: alpha/beta hydrolase [Clostridiaceae bacterium]|nr:alpha/beta hydrolase [Clostridiaceae bacterium]